MSRPSLPYYTASELSQHSALPSIWLAYFGGIYDVTQLVVDNPGLLVQPLLKFAGQDISHWFDEKTGEVSPHPHISPHHTPYICCPCMHAVAAAGAAVEDTAIEAHLASQCPQHVQRVLIPLSLCACVYVCICYIA